MSPGQPMRCSEAMQVQILASGEAHRRYDCLRYFACLAFAASNNWHGFMCEDCDVYEERGAPLPPPTGLDKLLNALRASSKNGVSETLETEGDDS